MAEEQETKKADEEILFPEKTIADITIKPWTFGKLWEVSPILDSILERIEEKGLDIKVEEYLTENNTTRLIMLAIKCSQMFTKELFEIIFITVDADDEIKAKIRSLSLEEGMAILKIIWNQNSTSIKNALSLTSQIK